MLVWVDHSKDRLQFSVEVQGVMTTMVFSATLPILWEKRKSAFMIPVLYQLTGHVLSLFYVGIHQKNIKELLQRLLRQFIEDFWRKLRNLVLPAVGMTDSVKLINYGFHVAVNNTTGSLKQHFFHIKAINCFAFLLVPTF